MRSIVTFAAVTLIAGMIVPRFATESHWPQVPDKLLAALEATPAESVSDSVALVPDAMGNFRVEGRVDGRYLQFVIDTGATVVALTADDAAALGIRPAEIDYWALVKTANGAVRAAPVQLDMIEVGHLMVRDVSAMILPDGALSDNLLGLSFLSRLRRFKYADGKMVLER